MTVACAARAAPRSFFAPGTLATQAGRLPQFWFMKSSISSAVVFGSTLTGFRAGAGGALMLPQSCTTLAACDAEEPSPIAHAPAASRMRFIFLLPNFPNEIRRSARIMDGFFPL